MIENSQHSGKLFYSIGEVAEMFNVNTSLIRFWEKEFDVIKPKKNKKGNRLFTQRDVDYFHIIYNLAKEKGYTLQGVKNKLKETSQSELHENYELIKTLKDLKQFLLEMKNYL